MKLTDTDIAFIFRLPPEDVVAFLRSKGFRITWDWHEMLKEAHVRAFTVAKAMRTDIIQDIRSAVDKALAEGKTLLQFQKELEPVLKAKGWWGRHEMLGPGGELYDVQLGSPYRLRTIYQTNLQTAYMAGRYKAMVENAEERPYWMYVAVLDSKTRPAHRALHGKVFRYDDPIWKYLFPPNGWGCRCRVRALTAAQVKEMGLTVENSEGRITFQDIPLGNTGKSVMTASYRGTDAFGKEFTITPDAGWDYNPGESWLKPFTPSLADQPFRSLGSAAAKTPIEDLPVKPLTKDMLLPPHQESGWSEEEYVRVFLREFGADLGRPVVYRDVLSEPVVISGDLFLDRKENRLKVFRADREIYLKLLADTIKDPAEIWRINVEMGGKVRICKRYVGIYQDEKQKVGGFVVFDLLDNEWHGTTAFRPRNLNNLDAQRDGSLVYAKK